jgi:hypothetical protein
MVVIFKVGGSAIIYKRHELTWPAIRHQKIISRIILCLASYRNVLYNYDDFKLFFLKILHLGALFPKKSFEPIVLDFILLPWHKIFPQEKTVTRT